MSVKIFSTGAAEEVTGSHHFVNVNNNLIEIDCGFFQGKDSEEKNKKPFKEIKKIKSILITHAHLDHCGMLPYFNKQGLKCLIYATPATRALANIVMSDCAKIQLLRGKLKNRKERDKNLDTKPIYKEKDVSKVMKFITTTSYNKEINILNNVKAKFFEAGHILGSSLVELFIQKENFLTKLFHLTPKEIKILYTGDLGRKGNPLLKSPSVDFEAPNYIVLESTYGNRLHSPMETTLDEMAAEINVTVARKGKIIIPSFAIERTQEMIYYLYTLMQSKKIPNIPIYVDSPMATKATGVFQLYYNSFNDTIKNSMVSDKKNPFSFKNLHFVKTVRESKLLDSDTSPMIIISANGMCEEGRITQHIANTISDSKNTLLFVGYMADGTLGRKILGGAKEISIAGKKYTVEATVKKLDSFSAHADYEEIAEWLSEIDTSQLKKIFLVHGDKESQKYLKEYLIGKDYKVEIIKADKKYRIS